MRPATEIIRGVRQTEKSARVARHNQYIVNVALDATKIEIRQAAKTLFNVNVRKVTTQVQHGKWRLVRQVWGRRSDWKKAIVTVDPGQKIEVKG